MKVQKLITGLLLVAIGASIVWYGVNLGDNSSGSSADSFESKELTSGQLSMQIREETDGEQQADGIICNAFDYSGELFDVSGGEASGVARTCYADGIFYLIAVGDNVPALQDGFFYEGWLVDRETGNFISTGVATVDPKAEGDLVSVRDEFLTTEKDYSNYNFYVLTLEPDDGNPAPAEHIIEGELN